MIFLQGQCFWVGVKWE
jgi:hypothetical protein